MKNVRQGDARAFTASSRVKNARVGQEKVRGQLSRAESIESVKPESLQKPEVTKAADLEKQDPLLAEKTVSNKEQRQADWAIMKEMVRYLWPKVYSI